MTSPPTRRFRVVGPGRAGSAFHDALAAAGWPAAPMLGRGDELAEAGVGVDLVLLAVPDAVIADIAAMVSPSGSAVLAHLSGSLGLDALGTHPRRAAIHPLASLPDRTTGARRLGEGGTWFALSADAPAEETARAVVEALGGRRLDVADNQRPLYHATATVAANHLVALMGQVERLATAAGLGVEPFLDLAQGALANVSRMGARRALTGPAARGDRATIERHLRSLPSTERALYEALQEAAVRLAGDPQEKDRSPGADP